MVVRRTGEPDIRWLHFFSMDVCGCYGLSLRDSKLGYFLAI